MSAMRAATSASRSGVGCRLRAVPARDGQLVHRICCDRFSGSSEPKVHYAAPRANVWFGKIVLKNSGFDEIGEFFVRTVRLTF